MVPNRMYDERSHDDKDADLWQSEKRFLAKFGKGGRLH